MSRLEEMIAVINAGMKPKKSRCKEGEEVYGETGVKRHAFRKMKPLVKRVCKDKRSQVMILIGFFIFRKCFLTYL